VLLSQARSLLACPGRRRRKWKARHTRQILSTAPSSRRKAQRAARQPAPCVTLSMGFPTEAERSRGLPGSQAYYLAKQLRDFTSSVRINAVMTPVASALTADDIADVAAYYAGIKAPFLPLRSAGAALIKQGEELAKIGSAASTVQACDNCHGISGAGEPPAIPYLAGQYASYIALEWRMWRRGFRKSSPGAMACLGEHFNDEEIAAAAAYYEQVRAPIEAAASHASASP
jgi:cytochrome c553